MKQRFAWSLLSLLFATGLALAAGQKFKTVEAWDRCRDKAEASVDQREVGVAGVEAAIQQRCGEPPVREPSAATGLVGVHPYDLVRSKAWKAKFKAITKGRYQSLVDRFATAGNTQLEDGWIVAAGLMAHSGGMEEAALAIDPTTNAVYAAIMEDGRKLTGFGFNGWPNAPAFLRQWAEERAPQK